MKTADEMFRELGYSKIKEKDKDYIVYKTNHSETIEIDLKYNAVFKYGYDDILGFDEIRAVAKLLDERSL